MDYTPEKREFYNWVKSINKNTLSEIDIKLINIIISNFDEISKVGTGKGLRATLIRDLIDKNKNTIPTKLLDISEFNIDSDVATNIYELNIGPFRGFISEETFIFDKKYTFIYGPNGSGKSSFCEGLEYSLLGSVIEAQARRIELREYLKNTNVDKMKVPKLYRLDKADKKVEIKVNPNVYQFSFIEKNRIDGFARISATTEKNQQERIASLFGLDNFNDFVNGFTENFEKYITLESQKETAFIQESKSIEIRKNQIAEIEEELKVLEESIEDFIKQEVKYGFSNIKDLNVYLVGEDGISGEIGKLQKLRDEFIPENINTSIWDQIINRKEIIKTKLIDLEMTNAERTKLSTEFNFKGLYEAIINLENDANCNKNICPACKTPTVQVKINPFFNATNEISNMKLISDLESNIKTLISDITKDIKEINKLTNTINGYKKIVGNDEEELYQLQELDYAVLHIDEYILKIKSEINYLDESWNNNIKLLSDIVSYNSELDNKREIKISINSKIKELLLCKNSIDPLLARKEILESNSKKYNKKTDVFGQKNQDVILQIEQEKQEIEENKKFVESYKKIVGLLKEYRDSLPLKLSSGLSNMAMEFYNSINEHDPDFEKIERLCLPILPGERITIKFKKDESDLDALIILSEGHIRILGLAILLAKVVNTNLGFIIFDDVINTIDDEHCNGVAELFMHNKYLKDKQQIITCHGEGFITKLEQILGTPDSEKSVCRYRFIPEDNFTSRGIRVADGNVKNFILRAKRAFEGDARKEVASNCRLAVENVSQSLWRKLDSQLNMEISVVMRRPNSRPDLRSVVDGLIKKISKINGLEELDVAMKKLTSKYEWFLLNKGPHDQDDLPEISRSDVKDLLDIVVDIEKFVNNLKIKITS